MADIKDCQVPINDAVKQEKRPPSSMSTGSADSGVFSSGIHASSNSSQPNEASSAGQTGPPSPTAQLNTLLYETANLMAVNEQLRKEIAENQQLQTMQMQMRALSVIPSPEQMHPFATPPTPNSLPRQNRGDRRMQKPESYKTVICQAWLESKTCTFAENCRFAHGEEELRPSKIEPRQNNKYKTKLCDKYTTTGLCPYGKRCLFIHPDHGPNAYIRADKLFEVSQRHALADLRDQMETQIMSGGRSVFTPPQETNTASSATTAAMVPPPQQLMARPSTPVEAINKLPQVPLGPTPTSMRGPRYVLPSRNATDGVRPHPSWPLEPSSYFAVDNNKLPIRPVSPFESIVMGTAAAASGMTYATMMGSNSTPGGVSGYVSGGSTPYQDLDTSAFSPANMAAAAALLSASPPSASIPHQITGSRFEEDSFSMVQSGFDRLAEDMAKHLDLW